MIWSNGDSAKGSMPQNRGTTSGITFCCSMRLQSLCSHFKTLVTDGEGIPYSLHSSGTKTLVGKSHWAIIASTVPGKLANDALASAKFY